MPTTDDRLRATGAAWRAHVDGPAPTTVTGPAEPARAASPGPHELRRRRAGRRRRLVALAALSAAAVVLVAFAVLAAPSFRGLQGGSSASCVGPMIAVDGTPDERAHLTPPTEAKVVQPGQTVAVSGRYFVTDCYDTGQKRDPPAYRTVRLTLVSGSHETRLATVHPDQDGAFTTTIRIPAAFPTGPATLHTDTPAAQELELIVSGATSTTRPQTSSSTNR
ncbi:hypothetical protein [Luteimicrobium sp. DT211]|uniref:hypothetical protein n=1 Tax=Luteimicrobium sp. DT211 TaxID=3393412 RepID=UPI003CFAD327